MTRSRTNHGTLYNGGTYAAGRVGQAFKFDGNNDHVRIPNQANLRFTNALTFEGWVYVTNTSYYREILSKWDAVGGYNQKSFDCSLYPGGRFYILVSPGGTDSGAAFVLTTNPVPVNTWTHVAGTYDSSTLKVYLNGVLDGEGAYANGIFPGTNSLGIGAATGGASPGGMLTPFPGMIDEPSLYARALSDLEILEIYSAGAAGKHNPNCATASTNIVGWWPGDGNVYDLVRTNFAMVNNGATYGPARVAQGFSFDGTNDYVEIVNAPDLNPTTGITLEAWVYQTTNQYQNAPIFSKDEPYSTRQYLLTVADSGKFRAHVWRNPGGLAYFDGTTTVALNTWYHVAMTYNRTNLVLYVNGVSVGSMAASGDIVTCAEPLRIGGSYSGGWGNYKFAGLIDEPAVYDRALTSAEVTALYAAGGAGKCKVDADGDGLTDLQEVFLGTSNSDSDSDDDGLLDGDEVFVHHTQPNDPDQDADGMLDGWEIRHFGGLAQIETDDYDDDGVNNGTEFANNTDPNTLWFETHYPNLYVSNRVVNGNVEILGGHPYQMALLVNSTNLATATWLTYNSNFSATLPNTDGDHTVFVALRGLSTNFPPSWDETELTLDRVPPVVVFTNPAVAGATVIKPYLQLQGSANEPLITLAYNLINAAGLFTNEMAGVVDQYFDTNAFDFTTNYFQAYDVGLTNGLNEITLTVSDRAGNVTVTNLAVTLDYTSATNPPTIHLLWPTNGMHLSGTDYYLRGSISDETSQVIAQLVETNGVTNEITGIVERNGMFWVEGLPLSNGTNVLTLMATDAAGNVSSTNLSVVKSSITLTIDSTPTGESLYTPQGTVGGTVSDPNYAVTVNGVVATVDESGNWMAENVPVIGQGTATFDVSAHPTGGGTPDTAASLEVEMPTFVALTKHFATLSSVLPAVQSSWTKAYEAEFKKTSELKSYKGQASSFLAFLDTIWFYENTDYAWSNLDPIGTRHTVNGGGEFNGPMTENDWLVKSVPDQNLDHWVGDTPYMVTHFFAKGVRHRWPLEVGYAVQTASARTELKLFTGGKAGIRPRQQNVISLSASVGEYGKPWQHPWVYTPVAAVAAERIQVMGKPLGADYRAYIVQPNNVTVTLPVTVSGAKHFNAGVGATKHRLVHNTFCTALTDANLERLNLGVGEDVWFFFNPPLNMTFPEQPSWLAFEGSVHPAFGEPVVFTAPNNAAGAVVRVFVRDIQLDTVFNVKEPTGYDRVKILETFPNLFPSGQAGALMHLEVYVAPTYVSFNKIGLIEVSGNAAVCTGYFENWPAVKKFHQGNDGPPPIIAWVGCDNRFPLGDYVGRSPIGDGSNWQWPWPGKSAESGVIQWNIPMFWVIGTELHQMTGSTMTYSIDINGKTKVEKFDKTTTRTLNNVTEPSLPPP